MLTQPAYWTKKMPPYHSLEGWQFEKERSAKVVRLKLAMHKLSAMVDKYIAKAQADKTLRSFDYHLMHSKAALLHSKVVETLIFDYKEPLT